MKVREVIKELEKVQDKDLDMIVLTENNDFRVVEEIVQDDIRYLDMLGNLIEKPYKCCRLR